MPHVKNALSGLFSIFHRCIIIDFDDAKREVRVAKAHQRTSLSDTRILVAYLGIYAHVIHRLEAFLHDMAARMRLFELGKGKATKQLVIVVADHVAAHRSEIAVTDIPTLYTVRIELHIRHLVLISGWRTAREQIRSFGNVRIGIDDLDTF